MFIVCIRNSTDSSIFCVFAYNIALFQSLHNPALFLAWPFLNLLCGLPVAVIYCADSGIMWNKKYN